MGSAFFGGMLNDVIAPGINRMTGGSNLGTMGANVIGSHIMMGVQPPDFGQNGQPNPGMDPDYAPGYQQPPQGQMPQQQDSQQYFQQMRQNLDGLSEAFKQIEQMNMPGGQYQGGNRSSNMFGSGGK